DRQVDAGPQATGDSRQFVGRARWRGRCEAARQSMKVGSLELEYDGARDFVMFALHGVPGLVRQLADRYFQRRQGQIRGEGGFRGYLQTDTMSLHRPFVDAACQLVQARAPASELLLQAGL